MTRLHNFARILALATLLAAGLFTSARAAEENRLLGHWVFSSYEIAPWTSEQEIPGLGASGKRLLKVEITFAPKAVITKYKSLACADVGYEITNFPPDALFQSGLPEPNQAAIAKKMGFPEGLVPGVDVNCSAGLFSYHFRDDKTVLLAFNNIIYTLTRK